MAAEALEQSVLESKDKDQLLAIAKALGLKASARTKKSDIIDQILETTGSPSRAVNGDAEVLGVVNGADPTARSKPSSTWPRHPRPRRVAVPVAGDGEEPPAEWELAVGDGDDATDGTAPAGDGRARRRRRRHRRRQRRVDERSGPPQRRPAWRA